MLRCKILGSGMEILVDCYYSSETLCSEKQGFLLRKIFK
jgi:hypothetical protein